MRLRLTGRPASYSTAEPDLLAELREGAMTHLRYMGFDQSENIRHYRFDSISKGQPISHFVVSAVLLLFRKHRVGIQEGPTLSMRRLACDLEGICPSCHSLTEGDLLDFVTARSLAQANKAGSRNLKRSPKVPEGA